MSSAKEQDPSSMIGNGGRSDDKSGVSTGSNVQSDATGGMIKPKFKPTTRQSIKVPKNKTPLPGTAASTEGTGASGNVFFASSLAGGPEEVVLTLEPTPTAPGKTKVNPNLPTYMQPVPKKRDRR